MAKLSFRPSLTLRGRKFKGPRGFSGKPFHPPLTDIPIGAYTIAPIVDILSLLGRHEGWARDFFHAATIIYIAGALFSVLTVVTGFFDWLRSTEKGTQARRTVNAHAWTMVTMSLVVVVTIVLRLTRYNNASYSPLVIVLLGVIVTLLGTIGGTIGGALVYEYGFNVETAGDSPVWHQSSRDLMPGEDK